MQRRTRLNTLYCRLIGLLFFSISVSLLLLVLITNKSGKSYQNTNNADRIVLFVRSSHNCQIRLNYLLQSWIIPKQSNLYFNYRSFNKFNDIKLF